MNNENIYLLIMFLIILIIFYFFNIVLHTDIENYGIYCGRYNLDTTNAETNCKKDSECQWNDYITLNKTNKGWCGQNSDPIFS